MKLANLRPTAIAAGLLLCGSASFADTSLDPRPAEIMPRAAKTTLIDLSRAGDRLVAIGDRGHVLLSGNGNTWKQVATPVRSMLNRAFFLTDQLGWIAGHDGAILNTADGGQSWTLQYHDPQWGKPFYDVLFLDENNGIVVGANSFVMVSQDGGNSWTEVDHDFQMHGVNLYSITQLGDGSLLISGEKGMVARSADAGESWTMLHSPYSGSFFGAMPDGDIGVLLYGLRGTVYRILDVAAAPLEDPLDWDEFQLKQVTDTEELAAMHWHFLPNPILESLFGGSRLADGRAILVGVNGAVVATAGDRMEPVQTPLEQTLSDALMHQGRLLVVGLSGVELLPQTH